MAESLLVPGGLLVLTCPNCDVSLTCHKTQRDFDSSPRSWLMCHYCTHSTEVPSLCSVCGRKLLLIGPGTQQAEEELNQKFPQNLKFSCHLAEVLIAMDELAPAEKICRSLLESDRTIFRLCGTLFRAMILERKGRLNEAEKLLEESLVLHDSLNKPDFHFLSMIYATQARIAVKRNNHELAEERYRKALKSSPFVPVIQEAEEYLDR